METSATDVQAERKLSRFQKAWLLTKGSWTALKLDKELVAFPVIGFLVSMALLIPFVIVGILGRHVFFHVATQNGSTDLNPTIAGYALLLAATAGLAAIGTIISGAITHGAIDRFKGNDPTIKSSFDAAMKRAGSLVGFGIFSSTVGYVLSEIANRIPFLGGKIVAWLADSAWRIASFFAIPVIVTSDEPVNPLQATRQSLGIIKKVWGESLVVSFSIAVISFLITLGYFMFFGVLAGIGATLSLGGWFFVALGVVAFLGLIVLVIIFNMLEAFTKAAIYYYAVTGESPEMFNKQLMRTAFTAKKARKAFSL